MWRRAVREVVDVEVEEECSGGAPLAIGTPLESSAVMVLVVGSVHPLVGLMLSSSMLRAKEVGVASALICRGASALPTTSDFSLYYE